MDFVDEENRVGFEIGEVRKEDVGSFERGPGGHLDADAHFAGEAGCEGCFAESGRAVEEDVADGFAAFHGGVDGDSEALVDIALADHLLHPLRAQVPVTVFLRAAIA